MRWILLLTIICVISPILCQQYLYDTPMVRPGVYVPPGSVPIQFPERRGQPPVSVEATSLSNEDQDVREFKNWIYINQVTQQFPGIAYLPEFFSGIAGGALHVNSFTAVADTVFAGSPVGGFFILGGYVGTGFGGKAIHSNQVYVSTDGFRFAFSLTKQPHDAQANGATAPDAGFLQMSGQTPKSQFVSTVYNQHFIVCGGHTGLTIFTPLMYQGAVSSNCFASRTAKIGSWKEVATNQQLFARWDAASAQVYLPGGALGGTAAELNGQNEFLEGYWVITGGATATTFVTNDVIQVKFGQAPFLGITGVNTAEFDARAFSFARSLGVGPWVPRAGHAMTNFLNYTFLCGGFTTGFTPLNTANFHPYNPSYFTNHHQASHYVPTPLNDVWLSTNAGQRWVLATANAPWPARFYHNMVASLAAIYVTNGAASTGFNGNIKGFNDLWQSFDFGTTWYKIPIVVAPSARYLAMATHVGASVIMIVGGIYASGSKTGATSREVYFLGARSNALDNELPLLMQPPALALSQTQQQTQYQLLLPVWAVVLIVVGVVVLCIVCVALVACRGKGTTKEKAVAFKERFKKSKTTQWNKAKVSGPVLINHTGEGNTNYTPTGGTMLDKTLPSPTGLSSARPIGKLRSDDPEMEMTGGEVDLNNKAMIGNFHLTGRIDPNSTYGSPRTQNTATTFGESAGAAVHLNPQQTYGNGYGNTVGYTANPSISTGYGQPGYPSTGFGNNVNNNNRGSGNAYGQTNYGQVNGPNNFY